jgi:hypothetical protein
MNEQSWHMDCHMRLYYIMVGREREREKAWMDIL